MALSSAQITYNKRLEKDIKKKKKNIVEEIPESILDLYYKLKTQILGLGNDIKIIQRKTYISFKSKTNFVDIEPHSNFLKCQLNIKKGILKDTKKIARDVSKIGHFGAGDYEVIIKSFDEIVDFINLIKQSYNINS